MVTEVMPNPSAVTDANGEWFEIAVTADVELNGLELGVDAAGASVVVPSGDCRLASAGSYLLFARSTNPGVNGNLPAVEAGFGFSLYNADGTLYVGQDGALLDQVAWDTGLSGIAINLDPGFSTPAANDDQARWCDAPWIMSNGDFGSPAAENAWCDFPVLDCPPVGPLITPQPGDLVITEIMPDPTTVSDSFGEWFEIYVVNEVDLNGLKVGHATADTSLVNVTGCARAAADSYVIFSRFEFSSSNGGLPPVAEIFSMNIVNAGDTLSIGIDTTLLDQVTYDPATPGAAWSLDPVATNTSDNDDLTAWCLAETPYGDGDLGTPAGPNPACP